MVSLVSVVVSYQLDFFFFISVHLQQYRYVLDARLFDKFYQTCLPLRVSFHPGEPDCTIKIYTLK